MRKIAVVTGSRSEYGLLKPLLGEMNKSDKISLQLIVTGTHLIEEYGNTVKEISADQFRIDASIPMYIFGESRGASGSAIGHAVSEITRTLVALQSDMVLVLGDRSEAFAAAVAAMSLSLPIVHLSGGEVTESGHIDEQIRHAITKMAHIHFPATARSAERIARMGEEPWRIFMVGDPGVSAIMQMNFPSKEEICEKMGFNPFDPLILCVQHPVSHQSGEAGNQMKETMEALRALGHQAVIIYPNGDEGSKQIVRVIKESQNVQIFRIFQSLPREEYLGIMKNADVMVGNSSSGVAEAPSFGLAVINIGVREQARENAGNIVNVPYEKERIISAVNSALARRRDRQIRPFCNPYVMENSSAKIIDVLEHLDIDSRLMIKKMTY